MAVPLFSMRPSTGQLLEAYLTLRPHLSFEAAYRDDLELQETPK